MGRCDAFGTGAQHQVIGVAQQNIGTRLAHLFGHHAFYGCSSAHGHECRRADFAARRVDPTLPRATVPRLYLECKFHGPTLCRKTHALPSESASASSLQEYLAPAWRSHAAAKPPARPNAYAAGKRNRHRHRHGAHALRVFPKRNRPRAPCAAIAARHVSARPVCAGSGHHHRPAGLCR